MLWKPSPISTLLASSVNAYNLSIATTGGNASSPLMYGHMFEDINHSGDRGIYAELIQNRAFQGSTEFPSTLHPWTGVGGALLTLQETQARLSKALPYSVNVAPGSTSTGKIGLLNPGWWGIDVKPQTYTGSFWVLGEYTGSFTVKLQSAITNEVYATVDIPSTAPDLIAFTADPAQTVLSKSWHAIKLLSTNRYERTVQVTTTAGDNFGPVYYVAGASDPGEYTFKVATYNATASFPFNLDFQGVSAGQKGTLTVLSASCPDSE